MIIGGCISLQDIQQPIGDTNNYHEYKKLPKFELKINDADSNTKNIIYSILNNTDQNAVIYISSINVVSDMKDTTCDDNSTGCTISNFTIDNKLVEAKIYILGPDYYKGLCNTFERTLYHEMGHVVYFYEFGSHDTKKQDELYKEYLELYAEKYADRYSKIQKEGCDEKVIEDLKYKLEEKEKIYEYSTKVLSKWDKYKNHGVPEDLYNEYQYDYGLYLEAKKEYTEALDKFKNYIGR